MNRIDLKFEALKKNNEKAMISFITAGDPDFLITEKLVYAMEEAGADIIELGIPYSDPIADGKAIQKSSARALKNGTTISGIMDTVKKIRENTEIPLVYLVYYNSVFKYGIERFIRECSKVGMDGLIIPDLPIEERNEILEIANKFEVALIPLVAPTSKDRIEKIAQRGSGFVYCISSNGVTGVRKDISTDIKSYMEMVSKATKLPKAIGFGISSAEMARELKAYCDGIIIGSAIVKKVHELENMEEVIENIKKFVREVKESLR